MFRKNLLAAACVAVFAAAAAHAESPQGFYVGASAGLAKYDIDEGEVDDLVIDAFLGTGASVLAGASSLDDNDTSFGVTVGYRFNPYLAVEARYVDLGTVTYSATGTIRAGTQVVPIQVGLDASSKGPAVALLGILPVSETWEVYAHGGVFFADTELSASASAPGATESDSFSKSSEEFSAGLGIAANFADVWTLRLEYERFLDVGDEEETGEIDVDVISATVLYRF